MDFMSGRVAPPLPARSAVPLMSNRARGELRASFARAGDRTEVASAFETGGYRLRLPRTHHAHCDAVMVNTGGGMAGGDQARFSFSAAARSAVTVTTTAAEKIYRAEEAATEIEVGLDAGAGAILEWLPQETILFDGARLYRRLAADVAPDGCLLMSEMVVFGRLAMGEVMRRGGLRDRWRVRRGGALIFAEDLRIEGEVASLLDRPALGAGARAIATVLLVAPDAENQLGLVRNAVAATSCLAGASAWNDVLVVRAASASPELLRAAIVAVLTAVRGHPLPRLWS